MIHRFLLMNKEYSLFIEPHVSEAFLVHHQYVCLMREVCARLLLGCSQLYVHQRSGDTPSVNLQNSELSCKNHLQFYKRRYGGIGRRAWFRLHHVGELAKFWIILQNNLQFHICTRGGTGRRVWFRSIFSKGSAGSIPVGCTKKVRFNRAFCFYKLVHIGLFFVTGYEKWMILFERLSLVFQN